MRFIILLFFFANCVYSQTLRGVVSESEGGKRISYPNIVLQKGSGVYGSLNGEFKINVKDHLTDTIRVTAFGYQPKYLAVSNLSESFDSEIKVVLNPKVYLIEEVLINAKEIKYTKKSLIGEKKNSNISMTSLIGFETAVLIPNTEKVRGKLKRIYIDLKKRNNAEFTALFQVKIYQYNKDRNLPGKFLTNEKIYVQPRNAKYRLWIDVEDYNIPFSKDGICVGIELINTQKDITKSTKFGPSFRYTISESQFPNSWTNYRGKGWSVSGFKSYNPKTQEGGFSNPMIGAEVLYPSK